MVEIAAFNLEKANAGVTTRRGDLLNFLDGTVLRVGIDDEYLRWGERLGEQPIEKSPYLPLGIQGRDDHADGRGRHPTPPPSR